ncbi:hypothetical protein VA603_05185 [Stenotrophomonas sp. MH1]|uniref:Transmembrane protein n=1 Tax=Stenotrophomonas capsici TaxID=3110230 RepID=A0ABU5V0Q5_9GAMM|nr:MULTISPECIES: hypothetical protein [unclassified Stenotrophomonas]MEA5666928.1 hypothetical protein [Stenotrophomonas sp. MH1]
MLVEVPVMSKKAATSSVEVASMPRKAAVMALELSSLPENAPVMALFRGRLHLNSAPIRNYPAFVGIGASAALVWLVLVTLRGCTSTDWWCTRVAAALAAKWLIVPPHQCTTSVP